ncbi:MAG: hypothetical protein M1839_002025 [Geoglossum umbratile]|nr:MAG: hypothetical protein M1839_002025 [Geoglossum umbratile]
MALVSLLLLSSLAAALNTNAPAPYWPLGTPYQQPAHIQFRYGGQSSTDCCVKAVHELFALTPDGNLTLNNTSALHADLAAYPEYVNYINWTWFADTWGKNGQFPCTATYADNAAGTPEVKVPYAWCADQCPGWELSRSKKLSQWVAPFVGFILPAVVFCLAIPRRRKLHVGAWFFDAPLDRLSNVIKIPVIAAISAVLVTLDTAVWLSICFALSGPMLLSGIYEAYLDSRILGYLNRKYENGQLTMDMRARLLYIVLVGNLDLGTHAPDEEPEDTAWNHVEALTDGIRIYPAPRQHSVDGEPAVDVVTLHQDRIGSTKTRLRTMLACQYSFGSTVGAPVVFFAGGFIYTLTDTLTHLGDNDSSHALAFGMWWMVIPHIAIVAGLLLAGNNPNTLEGVVGRGGSAGTPTIFGIFGLTYESRYRPAWMWFRGRSKRDWTRKTLDTYLGDLKAPDIDMAQFSKVTRLSNSDWATVYGIVCVLLLLPFSLAFITSYSTPLVGLSCRSATFLVYALSQVWLIALWTLTFSKHAHRPSWCYQWYSKPSWCYAWYALAILGGTAAVFSALGGTMMQIMGLYRNCLCQLPMQYWRDRRHTPLLVVSVNSVDDIHQARTYWTGTGSGGVAFLGLICYSGWWYQRRLKGVFRELVENIDVNARLY